MRTARRLALLIATYRYEDAGLRRLTAPAHDATALAAVLRDPDIAGFDVTTLINEPHYRVGEAIGEFYDDCRRDDLTLLYFTGHGLKDDAGRLYLATTNTRRDRLQFSSLGAEQIDRAMEDCRSRQKVLILDCCYSGAFRMGGLAKAGTEIHALERFQGRGRVVLTASDATQYAFEGDKVTGNAVQSVFTRYLVDGLRDGSADLDGDGDITIDELYDYAYDRVVDARPQQRPKKLANVEGSIVIARNVNWSAPPLQQPAPSVPAPVVQATARPLARPPVRQVEPPPNQRGAVPQPRPPATEVLAKSRRRRGVLAAGLAAVVVLVTVTVLLKIGDDGNSNSGRSNSGGPTGSSSGAPSTPEKIVVGSAAFPESALLAEIYAGVLAKKGIVIEKRLNIGVRETYYRGMLDGSIDLTPEFTGVLLQYLNQYAAEAAPEEVYGALKKWLPDNLIVLEKSPAQDKDAIVVTKATADSWNLKTIADLKAHQGEIAFGGPPEIQQRPDGLRGIKETYGVEFKQFKALDAGGPMTINALKSGAVQAADLFTTHPAIKEYNFVVLEDPKYNFAAQNVVPLIVASKASNEVVAALNAVSAKLTTEILLELNTRLGAPDRPDASKVAADWIASVGL